MNDRICPIDGNPCEKDCPDRFTDTPDGGCLLTLFQDMELPVLYLDDQGVRLLSGFINREQSGKNTRTPNEYSFSFDWYMPP